MVIAVGSSNIENHAPDSLHKLSPVAREVPRGREQVAVGQAVLLESAGKRNHVQPQAGLRLDVEAQDKEVVPVPGLVALRVNFAGGRPDSGGGSHLHVCVFHPSVGAGPCRVILNVQLQETKPRTRVLGKDVRDVAAR